MGMFLIVNWPLYAFPLISESPNWVKSENLKRIDGARYLLLASIVLSVSCVPIAEAQAAVFSVSFRDNRPLEFDR
jgi:hypothetical protein